MKRNRMMRIASFLLIAVLATTCAISGTFAKYTSDFTGTGSARVATWSFEVNDAAPVSNEFTFNLFDTAKIKDADGTSAETDVDLNGSEDNAKVIAPGTSGSFSLKLENLSEVTAQYTLYLTASVNGVPLQYRIGDSGTWKDMPATNTEIVTATDIAMNGGMATIDIYWQWPFGESVVDNDHAGKTVEVTLKINATQKD